MINILKLPDLILLPIVQFHEIFLFKFACKVVTQFREIIIFVKLVLLVSNLVPD